MVDAFRVIQEMVDVLSDTERGAIMLTLGSDASRVAL